MFESNEELFQAVNELIANLEKGDFNFSALELKRGFQSINGLTDGWALFLQSILSVQNSHSVNIDANDLDKLQSIYETVYFILYQEKPKPWWQLG